MARGIIDLRDIIDAVKYMDIPEEKDGYKPEDYTTDDSEDVEEEDMQTYLKWRYALQSDCGGMDIEDLARNEPTMIPDDEFTDYAQELAEDIGAIDRDLKWPYTCIDWEAAASELQQDYTSVDVDGTTYWFTSY